MRITAELMQVDRRPEVVRTPGSAFGDVRRLVVVREDRLGDLVLSLPAVDALRRTYGKARLALMVAPELVPLARLVGGVDEVLEAAADSQVLYRRLLGFAPDLIVCISRRARIACSAVRARVRHRVGPGHRLHSLTFHRTVPEHRRSGTWHEAEYALSFAHRAGAAPGSARFPLRVPEAAPSGIRDRPELQRFREPFVVLHPGSGGSCPRWPIGHYLTLAGLLHERGRSVVFSLGPGDEDVARALDGAASRGPETVRIRPGLPGLAWLVRRASLVVSNSTGPVHLAAALGTPTVALHAPWASCSVPRWGPYASNGWGLVAQHPEARNWSRRDRLQRAPELMAALDPRLVLGCVVDLLEGRGPQLRSEPE